MKRMLLYAVFCFICSGSFAQPVKTSNIHYRIIEDRIEVFYDLPVNSDTLNVSLAFYKKSEPAFRYTPRFTAGHAGIGVFSGNQRKITWYFKKEPKWVFTGSRFYFTVKAVKLPKKRKAKS